MFTKLDRILPQTIHALFIILLFCLPLIFWVPSSEVFELPKMLFVYLMTTLIIAVWTIRMILAGRIILRRTPLDIPILLFLLSQVISTIYSIDPHISWFGWYGRFHGGLWSTISYTLLYYAFVANISENSENSESRKFRKSNVRLSDSPIIRFSGSRSIPSVLILAMLASAVVVSLYAIFQHFGIDRNFWIQDVVNRVFSTQGQPNWLAAYLVMVIPLTLMLMTKTKKQKAKSSDNNNKIVFCLLFIVFFLALLFTKSRSGLLGFVVADIVFWLSVFAKIGTRDKGQGLKEKPRKPLFINFLAIHAIMATLIIFTNNPTRTFLFTINLGSSSISPKPLAFNPIKSELGGTESGDIRRIVWNGAAELVKQRPFFGFGPETFGLTYWQVRPKETNQTSEWNFLYNKAHNEWLNLAANTGLFGLGSHLFLLGWFTIWIVFVISRKAESRPRGSKSNRDKIATPNIVDANVACNDNYTLFIAILAALLGVEVINFFGFSTVTVGAYRYLFMAMAVVVTKNNEQ